jgi:hypothetical protein
MERKYQILSSAVLFSMSFSFKENDSEEEPIYINVDVDLANERVFFKNDLPLDIDQTDLEQEILVHIRPPIVDGAKMPENYENVLQQIRESRV